MQKMIEKIFLKLKTNIDFLVIISVFGILIYRIDALRIIKHTITNLFFIFKA